jgi:hypothetical protein
MDAGSEYTMSALGQKQTSCSAVKNVVVRLPRPRIEKLHFSHSAATIMTIPIVGMFQMIERAKGKSAAYRNA